MSLIKRNSSSVKIMTLDTDRDQVWMFHFTSLVTLSLIALFALV